MKKAATTKPKTGAIPDDWPMAAALPVFTKEYAQERSNRAKARSAAERKALAPLLAMVDTAELTRIADADFTQSQKASLSRMKQLRAASLAARSKAPRHLAVITAAEGFATNQEVQP